MCVRQIVGCPGQFRHAAKVEQSFSEKLHPMGARHLAIATKCFYLPPASANADVCVVQPAGEE